MRRYARTETREEREAELLGARWGAKRAALRAHRDERRRRSVRRYARNEAESERERSREWALATPHRNSWPTSFPTCTMMGASASGTKWRSGLRCGNASAPQAAGPQSVITARDSTVAWFSFSSSASRCARSAARFRASARAEQFSRPLALALRCARSAARFRASARAQQFSRPLALALRCARSAARFRAAARAEQFSRPLALALRCARSAARFAPQRAPSSSAACPEIRRGQPTLAR